jgi:two-component system response regulator
MALGQRGLLDGIEASGRDALARLDALAPSADEAREPLGAAPARAPERNERAPHAREGRAAAQVLVVDDDPDELALARRALSGAGVSHARFARDGREALELLSAAEERPRVIFADLHMPGGDGLAFLRQLRRTERTRDIPVVVVSSSRARSDVEACYRLGANGYVAKRRDPARPGAHLAEAAHYWLDLNIAPPAPPGEAAAKRREET